MKFKQAALAAITSFAVTAALAAAAALPYVDAEVRKLDADKGTVVLKHKDIPNLGMAGMTMQFDVADRKVLQGVKPGDKVKVTIDMVKGRAVVQELRPAK
jgi:Cu(I)/Ag(I) efflux system membrane protein CusA/SilA